MNISYINDFMYIVVRLDESKGKGAMVYCSGVNMTRFMPITKGRHGMGPSPCARTLQLTNYGVRDLAIAAGIRARAIRGKECSGIAPNMDTWFTQPILLENATDTFPEELLKYFIITFLEKFSLYCKLELKIPESLPGPDELQLYLESLCNQYPDLLKPTA